jgi:hypothetical protein
MKIIRRFRAKPYIVGSLARLSGFVWGYLSNEKRMVSDEFVRYLRSEEKARLLNLFKNSSKKAVIPSSSADNRI